jgi:hypothetical protein
MRKSGFELAALFVLVCFFAACSGKTAGKAAGPGPAADTGEPCATECCCRTEDGYYIRHACTDKSECSATGGRCLAPDTARCRL